MLVVTELPHMVNPDNLAQKIAELVNTGKVNGIADIRDDTSARTGQRLVIVLKRDAQPRVVLNNLYKHTQLQDTFGCNMLALVDDVPRTLRLDQFISYWVAHQIEVIQRRTQYRLDQAEEDAHIYRGLVKALDALDEVIALIRRSPNTEEARDGLIDAAGDRRDPGQRDPGHAAAPAGRPGAAADHRSAGRVSRSSSPTCRTSSPSPSGSARSSATSWREIVDEVRRRAAYRRSSPPTVTCPTRTSSPTREVVVTITRGGYAKRTNTDEYRVQKRGGKGVRGAALRADDEVDHLFATTNHHWILFFTNQGRVYRAKVWQLPEAGRDARGGHVAGLLSFLPGEEIAQVLAIRDYDDAPYLLLATRHGLVKKTALAAVRLAPAGRHHRRPLPRGRRRADRRRAVRPDDEVLLISTKGQAIRFPADDSQLRPMGRATSGVTGMKFRDRRRTAVDVRHSGGCGARTTSMCSPSQTAASRSVRPCRSTGSRAAAGSASRR